MPIMLGKNAMCKLFKIPQNGTKIVPDMCSGAHFLFVCFGRAVVAGTSTFARDVPNVIAG